MWTQFEIEFETKFEFILRLGSKFFIVGEGLGLKIGFETYCWSCPKAPKYREQNKALYYFS